MQSLEKPLKIEARFNDSERSPGYYIDYFQTH